MIWKDELMIENKFGYFDTVCAYQHCADGSVNKADNMIIGNTKSLEASQDPIEDMPPVIFPLVWLVPILLWCDFIPF